jgi:hypothetical protein
VGGDAARTGAGALLRGSQNGHWWLGISLLSGNADLLQGATRASDPPRAALNSFRTTRLPESEVSMMLDFHDRLPSKAAGDPAPLSQ